MQIIPLQNAPKFDFQIELDNNLWDISIITTNGVMSATLILNGTLVIQNVRCVAGTPLLPYKYQENGNFIFITQNQQYPNYVNFSQTQFLWYYSQSELSLFRSGSILFNPLGGAPLRYKPVGYMEA